MKSMTKRLMLVALGCALPVMTLISTSAKADITRHCRGLYWVRVPNPATGLEHWKSFPIPPFTAVGTCGSSDPNRCRERARDRVNRCMQAAWNERMTLVIPTECTASHGVTGYNISNLKGLIETAACCALNSPIRDSSGTFTTTVQRHSYGDKGCGTGEVLLKVQSHTVTLSDYDVDCQRIRERLCPPP
jgi:hypothetical protein